MPLRVKTARDESHQAPAIRGNNYVLIIFDSCRYDSLLEARPRTIRKLGAIEQRWSYASWTAPSHYNLLSGLLPHSNPKQVFASDYYKNDFLRFTERLGIEGFGFKSLIPKLYFPAFLQESLGYRTHAMVSLPVLNPRTILNNGFDTYRLMDRNNDMGAMIREMRFPEDRPSFYVLNVGETHYPSAYLTKLLGAFSTLGMAEDTWALNEHAIDSDTFLKQAYLIFEERKAMFFSALHRTRRGLVACVFDTTDRVQHMFFAQKDGGGPYSRVIEDLYCRADELVGEAMAYVDPETALFVLSDHGFTAFERGVDLNAWLLENGYLALKEGADGKSSYLKDIDWSRTRAYTFGLAGVYINQKGREAEGIVPGGEASALRRELSARLSGLQDEQRARPAVRQAWPSDSLYTGPYLEAAPGVIVGYAEGYRASWDSAVGKVTAHVFADNEKAWSGDHCVDPALVPGVLFSNRKLEAADPGIEDMAPTALDLFGIEPPPYMEGKSLLRPRVRPVRQEVAA